MPSVAPGQIAVAGFQPSMVPISGSSVARRQTSSTGQTIVLGGAGFDGTGTISIGSNIVLASDQYKLNSDKFITLTLTAAHQASLKAQIPSGAVSNQVNVVYKQGSLSASTTLTYYDAALSVVTSVSNAKLYVGSAATITLLGNNLLQSSSAICVFNSTAVTYAASKATYVASTKSYTCTAPNVGTSNVITVSLMYSAPQFDLSASGGLPITNYNRPQYWVTGTMSLFYYAQAPTLSSAQFSNTGGSISVTLSGAAAVINASLYTGLTGAYVKRVDASTAIPCINVFQQSSTATTGFLWFAEFTKGCTVVQNSPRTFLLSFSGLFISNLTTYNAGATTKLSAIMPGDVLSLRTNAVAANALFSDLASGSMAVNAPSSIPVVSVVASSPQAIPACSGITIDLSQSGGSAGRPWKSALFSFTTDSTGDLTNLRTQLTNFQTAFTAGTARTLAIAAADSSSGKYQFTFSLTNFLGGIGTTQISVQKYATSDVPVISITGPDAANAPVDQANLIRAQSQPVCGILASTIFQWVAPNNAPPMKDAALRGSVLTITPFSLDPKTTYTYILKTALARAPTSFYNSSFTFTTAADVVSVKAGGSREVGVQSTVLLNAEITDNAYGPSVNLYSFFTCTWNCKTIDGGDCIDPTTATTAVLPTLCQKADITGKLSIGRYVITVTAINTRTNSQATSPSSYLSVVAGAPPSVRLTTNEGRPSANSPVFSLRATVDLTTISNKRANSVAYQWFSNSSCNNDGVSYSTVDLSIRGNRLSGANDPLLKLVPGVLSPGSDYCFTVMVNDTSVPGGNVAYSSTTFSTRDAPSSGYCSLSSPTGTELVTTFSVDCESWTTDPLSMPVLYAFYIRKQGAREWSNIGALSTAPSFDTILTRGTYEVLPVISDAAGSNADTQPIFTITVAAQTFGGGSSLAARSLSKLIQHAKRGGSHISARQTTPVFQNQNEMLLYYVNQTAADYELTQDARTAQQKMIVFSQALDLTAVNSEVQLALINLLSSLVSSGDVYLDATSGGPFMINALRYMTFDAGNMSLSTVNTVFDVLYNLTVSVNATTGQADTCVSPAAATDVLTIASSMLKSLNATGMTSDVLAQKQNDLFDALQDCIYRTQTCDQTPLSFTSTILTRNIGVASPDRAASFCSDVFQAPNLTDALGTSLSSDCFNYACGTMESSANLYPMDPTDTTVNADGMKTVPLAFVNATNDLTLYDPVTGLPLEPQYTTQNITIVQQIDSDVMTLYNLTTYNVNGPNDYSVNWAKPLCLFFNFTDRLNPQSNSGVWSTSGCNVTDLFPNGTLICQCSHLSVFGVAIAKAEAPIVIGPGPGPGQPGTGGGDDNRTKKILGGVLGSVGGLLVVGGMIAAAVLVRKRRQHDNSAGYSLPTVAPLPTTSIPVDQGAVAGAAEGPTHPQPVTAAPSRQANLPPPPPLRANLPAYVEVPSYWQARAQNLGRGA